MKKDTIDGRFDKIMARLREMRETFLLVVDNIENPRDEDLDSLASLPAQVKVLVNSRSFIEGYEANQGTVKKSVKKSALRPFARRL